MTTVLGPRPLAWIIQVDPFATRFLARDGPVFVANDEAHHSRLLHRPYVILNRKDTAAP